MDDSRRRQGTLTLIVALLATMALQGCALEHRARTDASNDRADEPIATGDALDVRPDEPRDAGEDRVEVDAGDVPCVGTICNGVCRTLDNDPNNCGACDRVCSIANGTAACAAGVCTVGACTAPFMNCDRDTANGCEANTASSITHCGACGTTCTLGGGVNVCTAGVCGLSTCAAGRANCDATPDCETDTQSNFAHCGACGTSCARANATTRCALGACVFQTCSSGFGDCDGNLGNGCEINTTASGTHCGACNAACTTAAGSNTTATCSGGVCMRPCNAGFGDCDGLPANGCETNFATSAAHCGACGNACGPVSMCVAGACTDPPVEVSAGYQHTCIRRRSGVAMCWGDGGQGHIGDGMTMRRVVPTAVMGLTGATELTAGFQTNCAIVGTAGNAMCWGSGDLGQIGDGFMLNRNAPAMVAGLTAAAGIAPGIGFTCARMNDRSARCWGGNALGQLGNGNTTSSAGPVTVTGLSAVNQISAGEGHTCALRGTGTVQCWGDNAFGQLGDNSTRSSNQPVAVSGLADAIQIDVGKSHSCAVRTGGSIMCWGRNHVGQLGNADTRGSENTPVAVAGITTAVSVSAGWDHTCALLMSGAIRCWGSNTSGQIGDGTLMMRTSPVPVSGIDDAVDITTGGEHSCALRASGRVFCWGKNGEGQLGNGTTTDSPVPVAVTGLP